MIPDLRQAYNRAFSDQRYLEYCRRLESEVGAVGFRLAETPVFLPDDLRERTVSAAAAIVEQLSSPEHARRSLAAVPAGFDVPDCDLHPLFAVVDLAVARAADGSLAPRLIELQGFPSLLAFQLVQGRELRRLVPGGEDLRFLLSGLDEKGYLEVLGSAILGGHDPAEVVLFDLDPKAQKTACDFVATERFFGVRAICPTTVEKRGRELWYRRDGKPTPIRRVYNRLIVDELVGRRVELPFRYTEPLALEWAGHPNWYFRWSKHAIPALQHEAVPEAHFLSDLERLPDDLAEWVMKPLFSFAGSGVRVGPSRAELDAVPAAQRGQMLLMRRVEYAEAIATVDGRRSKCEIRVIFVWRRGKPLPVTTLVRMSQGTMMGVDYNKDRTWVGSSTALWP